MDGDGGIRGTGLHKNSDKKHIQNQQEQSEHKHRKWRMVYHRIRSSSSTSFVSFTHFFPSCRRMPLPALSLWPGRQPCMPSLVDGMR